MVFPNSEDRKNEEDESVKVMKEECEDRGW